MAFGAGAIVGKLGLDTSGFTGGMLQAQSIAGLFPAVVTSSLANPLLGLAEVAKSVAGAVASAIGGIKDAFLDLGHAADNMGELAEKIGVTTEFLTGVGAAAADAGSSLEGLGDAMKFLNNNAADAAGGSKEARKAFRDLGIDVLDATGKLKGGEDIFFELADAIAAIEDPAKRTQAAMNLMGRGGTELIPLMNGGSEKIRAFAADIKHLGATIDSDLAAAGDKFGTLETLATQAWKGIKMAVAEPVLKFVAAHFEEIKAAMFDVADAIRTTLGDAMKNIDFSKLLKDGISTAKELAAAFVKVDWRQLAQDVQVVAGALATVALEAAKVVRALSSVPTGFLSPAKAAFDAFAGPGGSSSSGGGGTRGAGVHIDSVTVNVDPKTTSEELGKMLRPEIENASWKAKREHMTQQKTDWMSSQSL